MAETIGKRIAYLRQQHGWTQQALAARLAISRVAVSHIEMDLTIPGERTLTLLAGLFKLTPHELVGETTYPKAKAERLPEVTCCYTTLELDLAVLHNDLEWLSRLEGTPQWDQAARQTREKWQARLPRSPLDITDDRERELWASAQQALETIKSL